MPLDSGPGREDDSGGPVIDAAGVSRRDRPTLGKDRSKRRKIFDAGSFANMLVVVEDAYASGCSNFDRQNLACKTALSLRRCGARMTQGGERILLLPADTIIQRNIFGSHPHVVAFEGVAKNFRHRVDHFEIAHLAAKACPLDMMRRTTHYLGTAGDGEIDFPERYHLRGRNNGLDSRPAKTIDRERRGGNRYVGPYRGDTREIGIFWFGRDNLPHYDMLYGLGFDRRAANSLGDDTPAQVGGRKTCQAATKIPDRGSHARNNED